MIGDHSVLGRVPAEEERDVRKEFGQFRGRDPWLFPEYLDHFCMLRDVVSRVP